MEVVSLPPEQQVLYDLLIKANKNQTDEIKAEIQQNVTYLTKEVETANKEIDKLRNRCIHLERKNRKNNVLIFGMKSVPNEMLLESTLELLNKLLGVNVREGNINNIYTIGKKPNPPIVIEFLSFLTKKSLFSNKEKLKQLKEKKITIVIDLCLEDREEQKILRKHLILAREQKYEASIKGHKLLINNRFYTVEELNNIEKETDLEIGSDNSSIEENIFEEEEDTTLPSTSREATLKQTDKLNKQLEIGSKPVVEKNTTNDNATKRNKPKIKRYSPKNTRSKKVNYT